MNPFVTSILLLIGVFFFGFTVAGRTLVLLRARPVNRFDRPLERLRRLLEFGFGQKRMVDPEERTPGAMHVLIFIAFVVLALRTIMMFVMGFSETALHVLSTPTHWFWREHPTWAASFNGYLLAKDLVALGALAGVAYFWVLRARVKPDRMTASKEAYLILGLIGGLMVTEFAASSSHMIAQGAGFSIWEPATSVVAVLLSPLPLGLVEVIGAAGFWTHLIIILVFLNFLPHGKHFHVITALPNVAFQRLSPMGKLPTPNLEKEDFGANKITDLHWKNLLDLYSCTECGRCQTHCPTYITGKPLTHKGVNQDLKRWLWRHEDEVAEGRAPDGSAFEQPPLVPNVLSSETIWACTSCGWCEVACPVFIENVPRLIEMRRYKVQVEADFPPETQRVLEGIERQGNPWGIGQDRRSEWADGLGIPEWNDGGGPYEYLFYVGCAGSYDDRQKKVSRAMVKILREAGVKFATLGTQETCNGEAARRIGNEYLYQTLAKANVETFNALGVKSIITQCPHCFNTLKNEYPDFGGKYDVITHSQLISRLLKEKRIRLTQAMEALGKTPRVTYHDPCYQGRHNGIYEEPRAALQSIPGLQVVEMQRSRRQSFCCGAGGGRMWMEERIGQRINQNRVNEAALTLAHAANPSVPFPPASDKKTPGQVGDYKGNEGEGVIAVSCPWCMTMMRDGVNETGREEKIQVMDVAELVAGSIQTPETPQTRMGAGGAATPVEAVPAKPE
jgi:Fe-S oxidoreductase